MLIMIITSDDYVAIGNSTLFCEVEAVVLLIVKSYLIRRAVEKAT